MKSTKLLFNFRYLSSPTTKYFVHTSLPLMNKDMAMAGYAGEQPHMRVETKAMIENKRTYHEEYR